VDFLGVEESALKRACCREGVECSARKGVIEKRCFCISGEFCNDGVSWRESVWCRKCSREGFEVIVSCVCRARKSCREGAAESGVSCS